MRKVLACLCVLLFFVSVFPVSPAHASSVVYQDDSPSWFYDGASSVYSISGTSVHRIYGGCAELLFYGSQLDLYLGYFVDADVSVTVELDSVLLSTVNTNDGTGFVGLAYSSGALSYALHDLLVCPAGGDYLYLDYVEVTSPDFTPTPTSTSLLPWYIFTPINTLARTVTPTRELTVTRTPAPSRTITKTSTVTKTRTPVASRTITKTSTVTKTRTPVASRTITQTSTVTKTRTPAPSRTFTVTRTPTVSQ